MSADKERAVTRLRELEAEARANAARIREGYDEHLSKVGLAEVIRSEGRADGLAAAVDVVQGVPF